MDKAAEPLVPSSRQVYTLVHTRCIIRHRGTPQPLWDFRFSWHSLWRLLSVGMCTAQKTVIMNTTFTSQVPFRSSFPSMQELSTQLHSHYIMAEVPCIFGLQESKFNFKLNVIGWRGGGGSPSITYVSHSVILNSIIHNSDKINPIVIHTTMQSSYTITLYPGNKSCEC